MVDTGHGEYPKGPEPEDTALSVVEYPGEPIQIPRSYAEALRDPINSAYWKQAISEELTKLQALDTWIYTDLPPGKQLLGYN